DQGILICAENPSRTLHKVSEIYDRIAFAGLGKYNEFDALRTAGVRHADLKGWAYSREDVDARSLANAYAQTLGQVFTHEMKPMEVEILVAEVAAEPAGDQLFHILYDGTVVDEEQLAGRGQVDIVVGTVEGGLDLVGQQELAGRFVVVLGHEDVGVAHRVHAVDVAPQLGDEPLGAQPGGDDACVERAPHRRQQHHA